MKIKYFLSEGLIPLLLIILLILSLNYKAAFMPMTTEMFLIIGLVITFINYLGFIWKEKAQNEREIHHRSRAGRVSFFYRFFFTGFRNSLSKFRKQHRSLARLYSYRYNFRKSNHSYILSC